MKRANREVSIFSLSALDVLAMATGTFVLLMVLLMPYYRMTVDANAAMNDVLASTEEQTAEAEIRFDAEELSKTDEDDEEPISFGPGPEEESVETDSDAFGQTMELADVDMQNVPRLARKQGYAGARDPGKERAASEKRVLYPVLE